MLKKCLFLSFILFSFALHATVRVETFKGHEIAAHSQELVSLCRMIYAAPPYLYNGDDSAYQTYLNAYAQNPHAVMAMAFDDAKAIGVAVGVPMSESRSEYFAPLIQHGYALNSLFYLGEFGLKREYRGLNIENNLFQTIEKAAKEGQFKILCFWELYPKNMSPYIPQESFWLSQKFEFHPELQFTLSWKNIGASSETAHKAFYWTKKITN